MKMNAMPLSTQQLANLHCRPSESRPLSHPFATPEPVSSGQFQSRRPAFSRLVADQARRQRVFKEHLTGCAMCGTEDSRLCKTGNRLLRVALVIHRLDLI